MGKMRSLTNDVSNVSNVIKWDIMHESAVVNEKITTKPVKAIQKPTTVKRGLNQPQNSRVTIVANQTIMPEIADRRELRINSIGTCN